MDLSTALWSVAVSLLWTLVHMEKVIVKQHWNGGFLADLQLTAPVQFHGWQAHIVFDSPVDKLSIWDAIVTQKKNNGLEYVIENKGYNGNLRAGEKIKMEIDCRIHGHIPPHGIVYFEGHAPSGINAPTTGHTDIVSTKAPSTSHTGNGGDKYDFRKLLEMSILFYEAQRSGKLPADNRIPWRGDSALHDKGDHGEDLTGGWYDAGDHVKFNFPLSASVAWLTWGLLKWPDAYNTSGQLDYMYSCIKWPLDYLLKCWQPQHQELYVQVGDAEKDHDFWGRAEDMTMSRPALKVTSSKPGSDVAGNTAAALAAGALAFKTRDPAYSATLLQTAKEVYQFAKAHRGKYSDALPEVTEYYASSAYIDDLALAAVWLFKATGDSDYLTDAEHFCPLDTAWALDWDDKSVAAQLLLFEETGKVQYKTAVQDFLKDWLPGGSLPYTPCGLAFRDKWGPNSYTANAAFLAFMAADSGIGDASQYRSWALGQIHYMLGDNKYGISFVVGYSDHYPQHVHHAGSSCPDHPAPCDDSNFESSRPNPQILKGALVGGPDKHDNYHDRRDDYVHNEVACDYNAGFQSALAALIHLENNGDLPSPSGLSCEQ